jgi:hypothetical protein
MRRWKAWVLAACLTTSASVAAAQSPADAVVQQLREQGYVEFEVTRTLLGRIRVVAVALDGTEREVVFNPATGEVLRDYSEAADGSVAPRILDRPAERSGTPGASAPSASRGGAHDALQPEGKDDGGRGHNRDSSDDGNPGRGHGNDSSPGGSPSGNTPSPGGGNGAQD